MQQYADELDLASEPEQRRIEAAIEAARNSRESGLPATGVCHNCHEPVEAGIRFCDQFCRDDHDYRMQRRKANAR